MVLNPEKCHFMALGTNSKNNENYLDLGNTRLLASPVETLLGIKIDQTLTFNNHVKNLCKKAGQKLNALTRISNFMSFSQKKLIFNSFIRSHFNYCPLIWMSCSRLQNNKINKIHERSLRIIYNNYSNSYSELMKIHNEKTVHQCNIQTLMIEVYKFLNGLSPPIMNDVFCLRENTYNLRNFRLFACQNVKTNIYGTETIAYKSSQLWNLIPDQMKNLQSLALFKNSIKRWTCTNCPCRLCKTFIPSLGFI